MGIYVCGTLRSNRGEPTPFRNILKSTSLKKGEVTFISKDNITITAIHDKKIFMLIDSIHNTETKDYTHKFLNVKGFTFDKYVVPRKLPSILDYNKYMGGVDKFDYYLGHYCSSLITDRRTFRFSTYIIDLLVHNSYILYKREFYADDKSSNLHTEYIFSAIKWLIGVEEEDQNLTQVSDTQDGSFPFFHPSTTDMARKKEEAFHVHSLANEKSTARALKQQAVNREEVSEADVPVEDIPEEVPAEGSADESTTQITINNRSVVACNS